jgi:predicted dienelactone hydrolase
MMRTTALSLMAATVLAMPAAAQNRIDGLSPDAPSLAAPGSLPVGVRTLNLVNRDQLDVLALPATGGLPANLPLYDRPLNVEVWYPALAGATGSTTLTAQLRDGVQNVALEGQAVRDAAADTSAGPLPLILLSHGFPGNRYLMSHFAENMASKGYVVASIDHFESTYDNNAGRFASTLYNRPFDQLFVLDEMARLSADGSSPLAGLVDADNTALLGYSMGGYGALITAGAGVTDASTRFPFSPRQEVLSVHETGSATHEALPDERIKTVITIGPWGRQFGFFDEAGLAGIEIPMLVIGGSNDTVSSYTNGIRPIWEEAINADRALLTFEGGSHNTVAPIPAPAESFYFNQALGFNISEHYTDPVWDTVFMNNVGQHFLTAWLARYLQGDASATSFLNLPVDGREGWTGFASGTADGLRWETLPAVPLPASVWMLGVAVGGLAMLRRSRRKDA